MAQVDRLKNPLHKAQALAILEAMREADCYRARAARILGRSESWLYKQIRALGLAPDIRRLERQANRRTWAPGRPAAKTDRRDA